MEVTDFIVEDLLDLPNGDDTMNDTFLDNSCGLAGNSTDSSTVTAVDSCNSSVSGADHNLSPTDFLCRSFADAKFSNELCFPYDDTAELEWLSKFVEESFSNEDLNHTHHNNRAPAFHLTTTTASNPQPGLSAPPQFRPNNTHHYTPPPHLLHPDVTSVPGKARSKISRVAPSDWSTRLLMVSSPPLTTATSNSSSETTTTTNDGSDTPNPIPHHKRHGKKRETGGVSTTNCNGNGNGVEPLRRCLHCAAEKTPQWRTGPMGPKTLCNACGVRYKSGRLVPEYRPAASPTFVPTKHSNSHRKVLELRRQRDHHVQRSYAGHQHMVQTAQQQFMGQNGGVYGLSGSVAGGGGMVASDQYLIHHHMGPGADHYRQMI